MDSAARAWIKEYKRLFDSVSASNAGMSAVQNMTASKGTFKVLGNVFADEGEGATEIPNSMVRKVGRIAGDNDLEPNDSDFESYDN